MIFPKLTLEKVLQVNDKTRLSGIYSFITTGEMAITNVQIKPSSSDSFISVFNSDYKKWYLDWVYSSSGAKTVTIRVTNSLGFQDTTGIINVLTEAEDKLFSSDQDLLQHENNILDYVPKGRSSWLDKHRASQDIILSYFDEQRIWKNDGTRLTKADVVNIEEVNEWSKFLTLKLIFKSLIVSPEDIFSKKAMDYEILEKASRSRAALRLDFNGDGIEDKPIDRITTFLVRR